MRKYFDYRYKLQDFLIEKSKVQKSMPNRFYFYLNKGEEPIYTYIHIYAY